MTNALSPLDGRYQRDLVELRHCMGEWSLAGNRLKVEVEWLIHQCNAAQFEQTRRLSGEEVDTLRGLVTDFGQTEFDEVRAIEREVGHDVKSIEYFLRNRVTGTSMEDVIPRIHFGCTSEDINNLSYALMITDGVHGVWRDRAETLVDRVAALAEAHRATPLLSRTHGQAATPSTFGKELAVFVGRWRSQLDSIARIPVRGKFNGAVGTYGAGLSAYPAAPWNEISKDFVESFGFTWNPLTTQIEPHDWMAETFHGLVRFNRIAIDFAVDVWGYISLGYLAQRAVEGEVGSSTMPHKVNPIQFENAEGNLGVADAMLGHLAEKLTVSRFQRDLSDSSALRSVAPAVGHAVVGISSLLRGIDSISVDERALRADLDDAWETLTEAVQTVMRKHGQTDSYEQLKAFSRGRHIARDDLHAFIRSAGLPPEDEQYLLALEPATYIGLADQLTGFATTAEPKPSPGRHQTRQSPDRAEPLKAEP